MIPKKKNTTILLTKEEARSKRQCLLVDASGKTLGRLAPEIAKILRGKHTPQFTPYVDTGDSVVIINASKIKVTGAKEAQKIYRYHTGAMSGMREIPYSVMKDRHPEYILLKAIQGMMPKNRLARAQLKKLRIYAGDQHKMQSQAPIPLNI
jgi:large subunit ribosomal protein L13